MNDPEIRPSRNAGNIARTLAILLLGICASAAYTGRLQWTWALLGGTIVIGLAMLKTVSTQTQKVNDQITRFNLPTHSDESSLSHRAGGLKELPAHPMSDRKG